MDFERYEKLASILDRFDNAMLVTHTPDGQVRARPMAIADRRSLEALWFITSADQKVDDIREDPRVALTLQSPARFLSLSGTAEIVIDPKKTESMWSEAWRVWFPDGPTDPTLRLIRVKPETAEYWDMSGTSLVRYTFDAIAAYVKGERVEPPKDAGTHSQLAL